MMVENREQGAGSTGAGSTGAGGSQENIILKTIYPIMLREPRSYPPWYLNAKKDTLS
ncbi:hypothetical protein GLO73106DRAFT_00039320 [Gloeocapsa sp. PCC 73106]|nr:hypothetical protein GLO73106DRAFT_00039320 [Gloeocapsa sp. PCC 73106]